MNWFTKNFSAGKAGDTVPITDVPHHEHFCDAFALDARATFPSWDPDLKNPTSKYAARLDRVFYTSKGLRREDYILVNSKASDVEKKYSFISDHVGSFVSFKVSRSDVTPISKCYTQEFMREFSLDGPFPWQLANE